MKADPLINARKDLRTEWNQIRSERLELKNILAGSGHPEQQIRRDREYRRLKKEQRYISKMIRHINDKIRRAETNG